MRVTRNYQSTGNYQADSGSGKVAVTRTYRLDAPKYGTFTCDTDKCLAYVKAVEVRSKKLTDLWQERVNEIHLGKSNLDPSIQAQVVENFEKWIDLYRVPWENGLPARLENCDSFLPGPCKDVINDTEKHEAELNQYAKNYEKVIGVKTGLTENPKKKKSANADDKKSWFSFNLSSAAPTVALVGLAGFGILTLTKK